MDTKTQRAAAPRLSAKAKADGLAAALDKLLYWARLQRDYPPCKHCDPCGEGNEVWGELTTDIEDALRDAGRPIHDRSPLGKPRISRPRAERDAPKEPSP